MKKLALGLAVIVAMFVTTLAYADYTGPAHRTQTGASCNQIVRNYDNAYICSFPKGGGSNYPNCGQHCGDASNVNCAAYYCNAIRSGSSAYRVENQPGGTVTLPNATASAAFQCGAWGNNGWCRNAGSVVFTANEPASGYVITAIETSAWGYVCQPNTASPTCTYAPGDGAGTATFWAESSYGDSSAQGTVSWKVDTTAPTLTPSMPSPNGRNGWFVTDPQVDASGSDATSGLASLQCRVDGGAWQNPPVSVTGDGSHTVGCQAVDNAGNVATWSDTVKVDTTIPAASPTTSGTPGANGWYTSVATVQANASDATSGVARVEHQVDGGAWQSGDSVTLGDGTHSVKFRITDNAGNTFTTAAQTVKVDATAPTANPTTSGTAGANGWYTSTATVQANASDATSGVAQVEHQVDGGAWQNGDSVTLGDGVHTVAFRVTDNAGNTFTTAAQTVKVDTTAPVVNPSVPAPDGQNGWFVTEPQVNASGSDATSGLASLQCRVDGGAWQSPPVSVTGDGTHTVDCRAQDNAGNMATTAAQTVKVDTTAPVSAFDAPAEGATVWGIVTLHGVSDDPISGPAKVEVSTDNGATWETATLIASTSQWTAFWDTRPLPDGDYTLLARAQDEAGNEEHTAIVHVTVANAPPQVSLHPGRWYSWQTAQADITPNPYIPLKSVTVTVLGPPGYIRKWEYDAVQQVGIHWNTRWYSDTGEWAHPGEYRVVVEAVDIYGHAGRAEGTVIVPLPAPTATPTPTATLTPTPMPTATPTATATSSPPTAVPPQPTTVLQPQPTPVITATPTPTPEIKSSHKDFLAKTLPFAGGIIALLAGALAADPRPKPTRGLAGTLGQINRYLKSKGKEE